MKAAVSTEAMSKGQTCCKLATEGSFALNHGQPVPGSYGVLKRIYFYTKSLYIDGIILTVLAITFCELCKLFFYRALSCLTVCLLSVIRHHIFIEHLLYIPGNVLGIGAEITPVPDITELMVRHLERHQ